MKWFKHHSGASTDSKLAKLRFRYGMEGYGLYWYMLELIAMRVDKSRLTFDLEHDSEVISYETRIEQAKVEEIMKYMIKIDLFTHDRGVVQCLQMAKWADEYTQKIISQEGLPTLSGHSPDTNPTLSDSPILFLSKNKKESRKFVPPSVEEIREYLTEKGYRFDPEDFHAFYESKGWMVGKNKMKNWKAACTTWHKRKRQDSPDSDYNAGCI